MMSVGENLENKKAYYILGYKCQRDDISAFAVRSTLMLSQ